MSERTEESRGSELVDNSLQDIIGELDVQKEDFEGEDIELYISDEEDSNGEAVFRCVEGASTDFRSVAGDFPAFDEDVEEDLLHDMQEFAQNADFAVLLPGDAASEFLGDDSYVPAQVVLEGEETGYVSRVWNAEEAKEVIAARGPEEFAQYLDASTFNRGQMLMVPGRANVEEWSRQEALLMNHSRALMSSADNVLEDAGGEEPGKPVRESDDAWGVKKVEVYPGFYDDVRAEEDEDGVAVYGDGELLERYDGFSLDSEPDSGAGPRTFELEQE